MDYRDPEWVAVELQLDKNTVYKLLQNGTLPAVQIGRKWLISETGLKEYLEEEARLQTTLRRTAAQPLAQAPRRELVCRSQTAECSFRKRRITS